MIIICAVSAKTLLMANPEQRNERKESIRLHRHHHRRRRWRRRRRRLSFDTVVIHWVFVRSCFFSHWLMLPNVCVRIEIWIENCYHKHIWLGLFLSARTQFAVNSITENIINHFGKFFCFFPISMCSAASYNFFLVLSLPLLSFAVFYSISLQSSFFLPARKLVM